MNVRKQLATYRSIRYAIKEADKDNPKFVKYYQSAKKRRLRLEYVEKWIKELQLTLKENKITNER